jgi:hypothetical protein
MSPSKYADISCQSPDRNPKNIPGGKGVLDSKEPTDFMDILLRRAKNGGPGSPQHIEEPQYVAGSPW